MTRISLQKDWLGQYPSDLLGGLADVARQWPGGIFVAGGSVRDGLLGRLANDLDITVPADGIGCARQLANRLGATLIQLDSEEGVARVVWRGYEIDFSTFREGAATIEADLLKRDFTINAMAVPFDPKRPGLSVPVEIIDPAGGLDDLNDGLVRCTSPAAFAKDPLRILRAYRFAATLGFSIEEKTGHYITKGGNSINLVASERCRYELDLIMSSKRASPAFKSMHEGALLFELFPELQAGVAMGQPDSHHLDVFLHSLATLKAMEDIQLHPEDHFPGHGHELESYLLQPRRKVLLKWAALFHDLGKPEAHCLRLEKGGRITFYNHDRIGARIFMKIAERCKWSRRDAVQVAALISMHMWPFHLINARRKVAISRRAYLRLVKKAGSQLASLFLLALADCIAGQGPGKPAAMEEDLRELYGEAVLVYRQNIEPVLSRPPLLNGHDLIAIGLDAGPLFSRILIRLQEAQVEGKVENRAEALRWVRAYVKTEGQC